LSSGRPNLRVPVAEGKSCGHVRSRVECLFSTTLLQGRLRCPEG
jgi:hypothetical protein